MEIKITNGWDGPTAAIGTIDGGLCKVTAATGKEASYGSPRDLLIAYPPSIFWILSEPDGWELSLDPFHPDAFKGTPAEGLVVDPGERKTVWLALDAHANAVGVAGTDDLYPGPMGYEAGEMVIIVAKQAGVDP